MKELTASNANENEFRILFKILFKYQFEVEIVEQCSMNTLSKSTDRENRNVAIDIDPCESKEGSI